jgi:hypothetical protein
MEIYCITIVIEHKGRTSTIESRMTRDLFDSLGWALPRLYLDRKDRSSVYSDIKIWDEAEPEGNYTRQGAGRSIVITKAKLHVAVSV